jgi:hypothetical protein
VYVSGMQEIARKQIESIMPKVKSKYAAIDVFLCNTQKRQNDRIDTYLAHVFPIGRFTALATSACEF